MNPEDQFYFTAKWFNICNKHEVVDSECELCLIGFWYEETTKTFGHKTIVNPNAYWDGLLAKITILSGEIVAKDFMTQLRSPKTSVTAQSFDVVY